MGNRKKAYIMNVYGQSALVTGASGLIGQAIVETLCELGVKVHATSRDHHVLEQLAERTGCFPHPLDITNRTALEALVPSLGIDILVNNAGVAAPASIVHGDPAAIDDQVDVNLRAVMHLVRLVAPGMISRNRGHIVMIGSMSGHYNFPGHAAYHATKAAIPMLCRQLRLDLFGRPIRVTEISPGRVKTDMFAKVHGLAPQDAEAKFFDGHETLLPEDIAQAVAHVLTVPARVNIGLMELFPTTQVPGGIRIA